MARQGWPLEVALAALARGEEATPTQNLEELTEAAPGLITPCVIALDAWRLRNGPGPPVSEPEAPAHEVGRSGFRPCGSGKKDKKCCGLN